MDMSYVWSILATMSVLGAVLGSSNPDTQKFAQIVVGIGFACVALTFSIDKIQEYLKRRKKS